MAGDRHGKHNTTTISFRVNSYEKATIEERVKVSGMKKQDYIVRSCIYNHVCVHLCSLQHQSDRKDWIFIIIVV